MSDNRKSQFLIDFEKQLDRVRLQTIIKKVENVEGNSEKVKSKCNLNREEFVIVYPRDNYFNIAPPNVKTKSNLSITQIAQIQRVLVNKQIGNIINPELERQVNKYFKL